MHRHKVTRVLPYTPEQLFMLVGEVALYPEFVPWLTHMSVRNPRSGGPGVSLIDAEAAVGFAFLKERFATTVRRDATTLEIGVSLLRGPFKALRNNWRFQPHPVGCEVVFDIEFEFRSRLLDALLSANFSRAVDKLIGCFEARAEALYGEPSPPAQAAPA